jgi:hypothetical protein
MLWRFECGRTDAILLQPHDAAVETNYYSIELISGEKTDVFEQFLSAIEGRATPVLREAIDKDGRVVDKLEREKVALCVIIAMLRVPQARKMTEKMHGDLDELLMKTTARAPGELERLAKQIEEESGEKLSATPQQVRDFILGDKYTIKVNPVVSLRVVFGLAPELLPILYYMRWKILTTTGDDLFLTSDNPVVYVDPTAEHRGFWGVGLMNRGLELTFPISPQKCLLATHDLALTQKLDSCSTPAEAGRVIASAQPKMSYEDALSVHVREINRRTVHAATRWVFSSTNGESLRRFIGKYFLGRTARS